MQGLARAAPFAVLLCAALYLFALTLRFEYPRVPGRLGPDVWPQAILVLLMLACAIGMVRARFVRRADAPIPAQPLPGRSILPGDVRSDDAGARSRHGLVAAGFLLFLAYPVALEFLGFLAATFLLLVLFMLVGQWRNPLGVLAVSLIGTLVLFYVFRGIVYVSLPLGVGPFQQLTLWVAALLHMR